jgi:hypothetical protein
MFHREGRQGQLRPNKRKAPPLFPPFQAFVKDQTAKLYVSCRLNLILAPQLNSETLLRCPMEAA